MKNIHVLPTDKPSRLYYNKNGRFVNCEPKQDCCTPIGQIKRYVDCKGCDRKPKQETLEEVAPMVELVVFLDRIKKNLTNKTEVLTIQLIIDTIKSEFVDKELKWQQERMYSEEEVRKMLFYLGDVLFNNCQNGIKEGEPEEYFDVIIEQFKKK
ncbi:MAG: hypothetical protein ACOVNP_07735 [Flavobacterium sp.]